MDGMERLAKPGRKCRSLQAGVADGEDGGERQDGEDGGGGGDFEIRLSFRRVAFRLTRACRFDLPSIPLERRKNGIESFLSRHLQIAKGKVKMQHDQKANFSKEQIPI